MACERACWPKHILGAVLFAIILAYFYVKVKLNINKKQLNRAVILYVILICFVPGRGLEPPWVTPLAPKASASTNFATPALGKFYQLK